MKKTSWTVGYKSNNQQRLALLPIDMLTMLGPWVLVRCIRMRYFLRLVPSPKYFLDAGCGKGVISLFMARIGLSGVAIDLSPESISETSCLLAAFPSVEVRLMDINSIKEGNFDIVFLAGVLEHIEDDASMLENIRWNLKMGGHLLLCVPCHRSLWSIIDEYNGHLRRYEADELIRLLSRTGYQVISFQSGHIAVRFIWLPIAKMMLSMRKDTWKQNSDTERTKRSGMNFLRGYTMFYRLSKLFLNVTLLPFFLALEVMFAWTPSVGYDYFVLARKVR